jgi:hypothetical protein
LCNAGKGSSDFSRRDIVVPLVTFDQRQKRLTRIRGNCRRQLLVELRDPTLIHIFDARQLHLLDR